MKLPHTETRYIMLDEDGDPVERFHQDDESDVCESDTIEGILEHVADRVYDRGADDLLDSMEEPGSECYGWRVVRQEIRTTELSSEEITHARANTRAREG